MDAAGDENWKKQKCSTMPAIEHVLWHAHVIWHRNLEKWQSTQSEERDFCKLFGCGILVCLALWSLLVTIDQIPMGGRIEHLLQSLMFMQTYGKKNELLSFAGGLDNETFQKWMKLSIKKNSVLEVELVSRSCQLEPVVDSF